MDPSFVQTTICYTAQSNEREVEAMRAVILCLFLMGAGAVPGASLPNFVVVMTDDQGYADLGCYGATTIKTPNIDRMAAEGVRFTSFYSSNPACTPSRAGLMTGRYGARMGLEHVIFPKDTHGLPADETTIAEILKEKGYATACIGKWHLGHLPEFLPTQHGFDFYYGIPYSNDMDVAGRGDPLIPLMRNTEIIEQPAQQDTLTQRYTGEAIRFITDNKDKPFFVYLAHSMPHVPIFASDSYRGKSAGGLYGDVIEELDANMGRLLQHLRDEGLAENTLVIFTSDNGPWLLKGDDAGSAGPLRDGKGTVYEGGMRVPCIAWWPGKIAAGRVEDAPAMNIDLLPTLARLAGMEAPKTKALDGKDISGVLLGTAKQGDRQFFYLNGPNVGAHRDGDWKIVRARPEKDPITGALNPPALYNLREDLGETVDRAAEAPEVVERLRGQLAAFESSVHGDLAAAKTP